MSGFVAGAIISVDQKDNVYTVNQVAEETGLPAPVNGRKEDRVDINWSFGPIAVTGYIDLQTYEIGVSITVIGISIGNFYGNLKEGLVIKINLLVVEGELKFYLKNGNELWVRIDLDIKFDGSYHEDMKILGW